MARDKGPTDDEFSKLMDDRAPNRLKEPEPLPEHSPSPTLLIEAPETADADVETYLDKVGPANGVPIEIETGTTTSTPPVDPKYADKSIDEVIEMHRNAEQLIGAQGQRLGDVQRLQSELDQLKGELSARAAVPSYEPVTQQTVDYIEESVIGNPLATMDWVEKNQPALKERALQTWAAIDPFAAGAYRTEQLLKEQEAKWEARLASVEAPLRATQNDTQLEKAYIAVSNNLPGFNEVAEDFPAILDANPELKYALVNGDSASKVRILENLGKMAFANRALAQPVAPAAPATPVVDPRVTASVASGSSTGEHGGETPTQSDKLKASMLAVDATNLQAELARNRAK